VFAEGDSDPAEQKSATTTELPCLESFAPRRPPLSSSAMHASSDAVTSWWCCRDGLGYSLVGLGIGVPPSRSPLGVVGGVDATGMDGGGLESRTVLTTSRPASGATVSFSSRCSCSAGCSGLTARSCQAMHGPGVRVLRAAAALLCCFQAGIAIRRRGPVER